MVTSLSILSLRHNVNLLKGTSPPLILPLLWVFLQPQYQHRRQEVLDRIDALHLTTICTSHHHLLKRLGKDISDTLFSLALQVWKLGLPPSIEVLEAFRREGVVETVNYLSIFKASGKGNEYCWNVDDIVRLEKIITEIEEHTRKKVRRVNAVPFTFCGDGAVMHTLVGLELNSM